MRNPATYLMLIAAALLLLLSSTFVINESQTAIVLNLGKIVRSDLKPGLHFKWPLVEEVRKFDRRILSLDDAPERYLTAEKKDVEIDFFAKWHITDVTTFYRAAYGQDAEFYSFYRSLEAYRGSMADGKTVLVLDPDSEYLKYFGTGK